MTSFSHSPFPAMPPLSAKLNKALAQWTGLLWQGHATDSFPDHDHDWIHWIRHNGLNEWQQQWFTAPPPTSPSIMLATPPFPLSSSPKLATLRYIPQNPNIKPTHQAVLLIPPCSHRTSIFDIQPDASLIQALTSQGHHVITLEWNAPPTYPAHLPAPGWAEYRATLTQIIQKLSSDYGQLHLMGLCLGGAIAIDVLAQITQPEIYVRSLTLLSTLLDCGVSGPLSCLRWPPLRDSTRQFLHTISWVPAQLIYALCCILIPSTPTLFSPISQWSQQGLNVSAPLAIELLDAFYARNHLIHPSHLSDNKSPLNRLTVPMYAIAGLKDRLVPVHSLFNGLHHCPSTTPIRLSLFEAGHLRCFLPGRPLDGYQGTWQGESYKCWIKKANTHHFTGWIDDWNQWRQTLN